MPAKKPLKKPAKAGAAFPLAMARGKSAVEARLVRKGFDLSDSLLAQMARQRNGLAGNAGKQDGLKAPGLPDAIGQPRRVKPTIRPDEVLRDPRTDEIGRLLTAMEKFRSWVQARVELKQQVMSLMMSGEHAHFRADKRRFLLTRVGSSMLYRVPEQKTGNLAPFRGRLVRVVCVNSFGSNLCAYVVAPCGERVPKASRTSI